MKNNKLKLDFLTQNIQKVFAGLVIVSNNKMLVVNYQGLVPVLINELKEHDDKISRLQTLVKKINIR